MKTMEIANELVALCRQGKNHDALNKLFANVFNDDPINRAFPPAKLARLTALKTAYDPANVFHLNQNIQPGTPDAESAA